MTDATNTDAGSGDAGATGDAGTGAGTQGSEGFVPQADFAREQARAREFQAAADRAKAEADRLRADLAAASKPATGTADAGTQGFDPDAFRRGLLGDVAAVSQMATSVSDLKSEFPHADPAIYGRLAEFGSVDALRAAVQTDHDRVAALVAAQKAEIEKTLREEYDGKIGGGNPPGNTGAAGSEPTLAQIGQMSAMEMNEVEKKYPGLIDRLLRSA